MKKEKLQYRIDSSKLNVVSSNKDHHLMALYSRVCMFELVAKAKG